MQEQLIAKYKKELAETEVVKYINSVVTFNAIRNGTGGYNGKENLDDFTERLIVEVLAAQRSELAGKVRGMKWDEREMNHMAAGEIEQAYGKNEGIDCVLALLQDTKEEE